MKLLHYAKDNPPAWANDVIVRPRDPVSTIHGAKEGAWTYRTIAPGDIVLPEWVVVWSCKDRVLIKYTHWEKVSP